ncbi:AAA-ATPase, partial [Mucuna pruriens]
MSNYKSLVSAVASLAASAMLIRSISNEFVPREVIEFFYSGLHNLSRQFSTQLTIVIEEFQGMSKNQVFEAAEAYLGTKATLSAQRVKASKSENDKRLSFGVDRNEEVNDRFEGVRVRWKYICKHAESSSRNRHHHDMNASLRSEIRYYELSFPKKHKEKIFNSYLPHVLERAKAIKQENEAVKLHTVDYRGYWKVPGVKFGHPMTFKTLAIDAELKREVVSDLDKFVKGKEFYKRTGKAWKRGYLLYGPPGTGKSSLIAAMACYLNYDIYDLDLTAVNDNNELKNLILGMSNRSILVIEDIDCTIKLQNREEDGEAVKNGDNKVTLSGLLNVIDGLWSCCGEERVVIFTTNHKERLDPALLRPGRMDMHIHLSYCNFSAFQQLAFNYLRISQHKLFQQIEGLMGEVQVTPAEIAGELIKISVASEGLHDIVKFLHNKKMLQSKIIIDQSIKEDHELRGEKLSKDKNGFEWYEEKRKDRRKKKVINVIMMMRKEEIRKKENELKQLSKSDNDKKVSFGVDRGEEVNDIDDFEGIKSLVTLSELLNVIDGLWPCCGEEHIVIFTINHEKRLDPALLSPGRMDMHIHLSYIATSQKRKFISNSTALISAVASLAASAMLIRSITKEFMPPEVLDFFSSQIHYLSRQFSSQLTIVIDEFQGMSRNQVFEAAEVYLGTKATLSALRVKASKSEDDRKLAFSVDRNEEVTDDFEEIQVKWKLICDVVESHGTRNFNDMNSNLRSEVRSYELSFHKKHKEKIFDSYLPYVLERAKAIKQENMSVKLHTIEYDCYWNGQGIKFGHPMTFNTLAIDEELKREVVSDLDKFVKGKEFYKRTGKAWKRGYLLYGPPGTGKSSLIAAMANYLNYDIYDLDLTIVHDNKDLKNVILGMSNRSILVIEDIDCTIKLQNREEEKEEDKNKVNKVTLSGLLNAIDGLWSCCGEERIIIFTTNHKEKLDPALLRPGRMDMHIHLSYCTFSAFKQLTLNYLGISQHQLFEHIEGLLREVNVTPAEMAGELTKSADTKAPLQDLVNFLHSKKILQAKTVIHNNVNGHHHLGGEK